MRSAGSTRRKTTSRTALRLFIYQLDCTGCDGAIDEDSDVNESELFAGKGTEVTGTITRSALFTPLVITGKTFSVTITILLSIAMAALSKMRALG
ncbi:hypothetical protein BIY29_01455 [Brenneria alni]|uniref:Uncharacterized protein n=1 Tax=Brenneria alni TaxID=71656 RepID=A0A421DTE9_9GAMM|nr:hypothetical protein BIY29_01455 [Brenneria alni]